MAFDFRSDDVLLDIDGVCKKLSISRSSLERLRRTNGMLQARSYSFNEHVDDFAGMPPFPEPTIMLGRSPRWSAQELNVWINSNRPSPKRY
jgi:predicted DNA-binding transcriptional regulator AlpA